jgi:hypothetical protein
MNDSENERTIEEEKMSFPVVRDQLQLGHKNSKYQKQLSVRKY